MKQLLMYTIIIVYCSNRTRLINMLSTFTRISTRYFSQTTTSKLQICIVGAGAAGFYAAQHLVKKLTDARVDIIEKLPVPFGLVRSANIFF